MSETGAVDMERALLRHEMRTPLHQILGYSELLEEESEIAGQSGMRADLQRIQTAARHLLGLIDQYLGDGDAPAAEALVAPPEEPLPVVLPTESGCLLLVDDNETNRGLLARRLAAVGYEVRTAGGGLEALSRQDEPGLDLILLDVLMPDLSGLEVLQQLRARRTVAELPVIMVTSMDRSQDTVRCLRHGANDYVTKPIDFPVLLARIETQLQLKRLSQLKDEFIAIASHDLKNPLTVVMGTAQYLESDHVVGQPISAQMMEMIANIGTRARSMKRIIEDFLDFEALKDGRLDLKQETVALEALLRDAARAHQDYAAGKRIELAVEAAPVPAVAGDAARLAQVVENLVSNAIKFSGPGTRVVLRCETAGEEVRVAVRDAGPGLRPEDFARLFVRYARLSNRPTGSETSTGLGLSICKQIVERHGGRIGAENNPEGGATFWFAIPRAQAEERD